jgi:putative alpha-1,2-mannosidase
VTPNYARSVSRTIEYSANDFAVAQIAKGEAKDEAVVKKYLQRSAGWQKIWNRNISSFNFTGFLAPTYPNGTVQANTANGSYTPDYCGDCEWGAISYEALPWEYR